MPAAGYRNDTSLNNAGSNGNYWSSTAPSEDDKRDYAYIGSGILQDRNLEYRVIAVRKDESDGRNTDYPPKTKIS